MIAFDDSGLISPRASVGNLVISAKRHRSEFVAGTNEESATVVAEHWATAHGEQSSEQSKQVWHANIRLRFKSSSCPEG